MFSQSGWRTFCPGSGHSGVRNGGFLPAGLHWSLRGRAEHKGAAGPGACFVCTRSSQSVLAGWKRAGGSDIYMSIRKPAPAAPPLHLASRTSVLFPLTLGASSLWLPTSIWQTPSERFAIPLTVLSLNEYISNQPAGFPNGPGSHTGEMLALDQDGGHTRFQKSHGGRGKDKTISKDWTLGLTLRQKQCLRSLFLGQSETSVWYSATS